MSIKSDFEEAKRKPDFIKVNRHTVCRYLDIVISHSLVDRHHNTLIDFLKRGVPPIRGGASGPWDEDDDYVHLQFFLNETVADEYAKIMGVGAKNEL